MLLACVASRDIDNLDAGEAKVLESWYKQAFLDATSIAQYLCNFDSFGHNLAQKQFNQHIYLVDNHRESLWFDRAISWLEAKLNSFYKFSNCLLQNY